MRKTLRLVYAGSLESLLTQSIFPQFETLTGYHCHGQAGGSREWARKLRMGEAEADVFLSADAQVNDLELMGEANGRVVEWYLTFATNEMVLAYTPDKIAPGMPLLRILRSGLRLCRADPEADPKGYRAIHAMQLLEQHLHEPGLTASVLGEARNPRQLVAPADMINLVAKGDYDLGLTYRSQAVESDIPFLAIPDEVNLGSPDYATEYARVSYTCTDGAIYRGALISYTAAMLTHCSHPAAAAAFLTFLASRVVKEMVERHGFRGIATYISRG